VCVCVCVCVCGDMKQLGDIFMMWCVHCPSNNEQEQQQCSSGTKNSITLLHVVSPCYTSCLSPGGDQ
jgi:hypothetical protein